MKGPVNFLLLVRTVLLGVTFLLLAVIPPEVLAHFPSICVFKNLFGFECAGCGMTRAVSSVLHLDLTSAMVHNQLVVVVVPLLLGVFLVDLLRLLLPRAKQSVSLENKRWRQ